MVTGAGTSPHLSMQNVALHCMHCMHALLHCMHCCWRRGCHAGVRMAIHFCCRSFFLPKRRNIPLGDLVHFRYGQLVKHLNVSLYPMMRDHWALMFAGGNRVAFDRTFFDLEDLATSHGSFYLRLSGRALAHDPALSSVLLQLTTPLGVRASATNKRTVSWEEGDMYVLAQVTRTFASPRLLSLPIATPPHQAAQIRDSPSRTKRPGLTAPRQSIHFLCRWTTNRYIWTTSTQRRSRS